jgi:hypothetical protein
MVQAGHDVGQRVILLHQGPLVAGVRSHSTTMRFIVQRLNRFWTDGRNLTGAET